MSSPGIREEDSLGTTGIIFLIQLQTPFAQAMYWDVLNRVRDEAVDGKVCGR